MNVKMKNKVWAKKMMKNTKNGIVQIEPRFIEHFVKPADARDIPTWPTMPDESRKPMLEKKRD